MNRGGLYVHIPYCRKKCLYCDFFSGGVAIAEWENLCISLTNELKSRIGEVPENVVSIYFGGGTPSAMPPELFVSLLSELRMLIRSSLEDEIEITIEANPEDVNDEIADLWYKAGVNRVSLGFESFNDGLLESVGRRHSGDEATSAFQVLRDRFDNISADLIFGLPGQTVEMWRDDIERLVKLRPTHISAYSLMYEPGTALTLLRDQKRIEPVSEESVLEMFETLSKNLVASGYERYEISNYSLPGFESRHNSLYWKGMPYLGLGPSAHSYDGFRIRRGNPADLKGYYKRYLKPGIKDSDNRFFIEEILGDEELVEEFILTRMRLKDGFCAHEFEDRFGSERFRKVYSNAETLSKKGLIDKEDGRIRLTERGIMISDSAIVDLLM